MIANSLMLVYTTDFDYLDRTYDMADSRVVQTKRENEVLCIEAPGKKCEPQAKKMDELLFGDK